MERILDFHRANAAKLVETVTCWQSCSQLSTRHRSCVALWTSEVTLCPPDNPSTASTISQCAAEIPNRRMTKVDVRSQWWWNLLIHLCFCRLVCAIKFFRQGLAPWSLWSRSFPAMPRARAARSEAFPRAAISSRLPSSSLCNGPSCAIASCCTKMIRKSHLNLSKRTSVLCCAVRAVFVCVLSTFCSTPDPSFVATKGFRQRDELTLLLADMLQTEWAQMMSHRYPSLSLTVFLDDRAIRAWTRASVFPGRSDRYSEIGQCSWP